MDPSAVTPFAATLDARDRRGKSESPVVPDSARRPMPVPSPGNNSHSVVNPSLGEADPVHRGGEPMATGSNDENAAGRAESGEGRSGDSRSGDSRSGDIMKHVYGPILQDMAAVDARLHLELQSRYEAIVPVLRHGTQLGGKRLRPALLLLSALATGCHLDSLDGIAADSLSGTPADGPSRAADDLIVMATVVEMVHTATLVHDDVLDNASTRRHVPTINARWNNDTSILLGDYLFSQSFYLAATLPSTLACRWVGQAAQRVCEGELRQVLGRDWLDIDEETYLDIIRGKTAELTRVACQLGAHLRGGDDATVAALGTFGNDLGIAFQIADDFLDLWGDDDQVGKTLGTDLAQGKITLPLIRLLRHDDPAIARNAEDALRSPPEQRLAKIRPLLRQTDAAEFTRQTAHRYRDSAIAAIASLKPSAATNSLRMIADFSVDRRF